MKVIYLISKDAGKRFDNIPHPFTIKTLNKLGIEKNVFQHNKGYICQALGYHHTQQ